MGFGVLKGVAKVASSAATGGWKALGGVGSHLKGALALGGASYAGWQWMSTGHLPGERLLSKFGEVAEKTGNVVSDGLDVVGKGLNFVNKGLDKAPDLIHDTRDALVGGGVGEGTGQGGGLLGNLFGGVSKLLDGLGSGGMGSMLGLAAGAYLLFGGFGWMGKIGGILLAALSLGLFGINNQQQQVQAAQQHVPVAPVQTRQESVYSGLDLGGQDVSQEDSGYTVHRGR